MAKGKPEKEKQPMNPESKLTIGALIAALLLVTLDVVLIKIGGVQNPNDPEYIAEQEALAQQQVQEMMAERGTAETSNTQNADTQNSQINMVTTTADNQSVENASQTREVVVQPEPAQQEREQVASASEPVETAADEPESNYNISGNNVYEMGQTWTVPGQWKLTVTACDEMSERNEYSDKSPAAVYLVTYTYTNLGYVDNWDMMDGLYMSLEEIIVDSNGKTGYSYPNSVTKSLEEAPVGATCEGQVCIGVDHAGPFTIHYSQYDGNSNKQKAVFKVHPQ